MYFKSLSTMGRTSTTTPVYYREDKRTWDKPRHLRPNPKSLIGELSRLWHRVKVDSGIGLSCKYVGVDSEVDIS